MFSHTLDVQNGKYSYIQETNHEECERLHIFHYFRMGHIYINGLIKSNSFSSYQVDNDGTCNGGTYNMPNLIEHGQML